jgi:curli biogenesis system outer membrane secretion channel CsgG
MKTSFAMAGLAVALLAGCQSNQVRLGDGGSMAGGSQGAAGVQGASSELLRCDYPIGSAALVESPYAAVFASIPGHYNPTPLVRLMMAQSRCFTVVDRGIASGMMQGERMLARGGQLQKGSHMGGGQIKAVDYLITPSITRGNPGASSYGGGLGGLYSGFGGLGGLRVRKLEAEVMLAVTNARSGVQEAVAQGSASKQDISFGGVGILGLVGALGGGGESTDMQKMLAAAFVDAHNKLVRQLRPVDAGAAGRDQAGYRARTTVNLRAGPSTASPVMAKVAKGTPVRPIGPMLSGRRRLRRPICWSRR